MTQILIVDASVSQFRVMSGLLSKAGYDPKSAENIENGLRMAADLPPGSVILTAMRLPDGTARSFIEKLREAGYGFPVLALVDNLYHINTIDVLRGDGAVDVIQRQAIDKQLVEIIGQYSRPEHVIQALGNQIFPRVSEAWKEVEAQIDAIAATNANAIIIGESGTGKLQVALQIYQRSSKGQKPYTIVEAGSAEFVGEHDPVSNQSKLYNRIRSYFQKVEGGTIIIKNVHLISLDKQSVLLHILTDDHPDVRVICTAEPELKQMAAEKQFRTNLYYTLRQRDIALPALRDVTMDIPSIADFILKVYSAQTDTPRKILDPSAVKALKLYPWPGNVRELKNAILFAAFQSKTDTISADDINFNLSEPNEADVLTRFNIKRDKANVIKAYKRAGTWKGAAALLGISERALYELRKKYGIDKSGNATV